MRVPTVHLLYKQGLTSATRLIRGFEGAGVDVVPLESTSASHIAELLDRPDIDRLVVAGGDGMVHHAVQTLAGSGTELAIIPAGTGNDIARALGFSATKRGTAATMQRCSQPGSRPLDLLRIADRTGRTSFVASILTAGFSGLVTERANRITRVGGQLKYTLATLGSLPRLDAYHLRGLGAQHTAFSILAIGNTRYFGGGMEICPGARPDDGRMAVVVIDPVHPLHLAAVLPAAFVGQHVRSRRVHTSDRVSLELDTDARWWADGEPLDHTGPVEVHCVPGALRVVGP